MHRPWLVAGAILLAAWPGAARGQSPVEVPHVGEPPEIDGRLREAAWSDAARLDDWVQTLPGDNAQPDGESVLLLAHDDEALYIGFRGTDPAGIRYAIHPRDQVLAQGQDWIGILLDTFDDRRQSFGFALNPLGIQGDGMMLEGGGQVEWDAIFQTAGEVDPDGRGFTVEARIPFRSLRFRRGERQLWGLAVTRTYGRTGATDSPWPLDRNLNCTLCQMRPIRLGAVEPGRNLEVNPALVVGGEAERPEDGPALDAYDARMEPGLNVKYGITSNLTLDATLNPDFSQVESDAGQLAVNTRFALFFPEKRPFFLEGADVFETAIVPPGGAGFIPPPISLFYSRTVVDPDWGGKLSGKAGAFGLGAIVGHDAAEPVDVDEDFARPGSDVAVGRATVDIFEDGYLGALFTGRRNAGTEDALGGVDARVRFSDNLVFRGLAATSHYEAGRHEGEPTREDAALQLQVDWLSRHLVAGAALIDVGPDFVAPLGFVPRSDQILATAAVAPVWQGTGLVHRIQPQLRYERIWEHDGRGVLKAGRLVDVLWEPSLSITLARSLSVGSGYHRAYTYYDGQEFPDQDRIGFFFASQTLDWLHVNGWAGAGESVIFEDRTADDVARPAWAIDVSLTATVRPSPPMRADLSLLTSRIWRRTDAEARASRYADAVIPRLRVEYQVNRRLGLRAVGEWSRSDFRRVDDSLYEREEQLGLEFLASYVLNAGSAVYLGWTDLQEGDLERRLSPERRGGVAKATYVWRF